MSNKVGQLILILFFVSSLFLMTSCVKREIIPEIPVTDHEAAERARIEAENRARALEEARMRRAQMERQRASEMTVQKSKDDLTRQNQIQKLNDDSSQKDRFEQIDIFFDYNESTLRWESQEELRFKAQWLRSHPDETVIIEGHCDERGSEEYNLALGEKRAEAAKAFLIDLEIPGMMMRTVSYGEERPVDRGHSEEAWAKNRRAHFILE